MAGLSYAVGDLHGRFDLLEKALTTIERHAAGRKHKLIFLGDYIDRGPDSMQVVERLISLSGAGRAMCLKGNHEQMLCDAIRTGDASLWLSNGGRETLQSFGGWIPNSVIEWMENLPLTHREPGRLYVHAGILPGVEGDPDEEVALWIRDRFLRAPTGAMGGLHIVHGHTPVWSGKLIAQQPELLPHRTNLDTGAYFTGVLCIAVFDLARPSHSELLRVRAD